MTSNRIRSLVPGLVPLLLVAGCVGVSAEPVAPVPALDAREGNGIIADAPPFALDVATLLAWTPDGPSADARNVSAVPLAPRFVDPGTPLDRQVRVLYAPDGVNNFGNYLAPQNRFNLYNFIHWSRIDLLNWFAAAGTVNLPPRPWVDAAHRNGVKVLGTVFFAPVIYNGSAETVDAFLLQAPDGSFPAADQLVRIAAHYGFDGWLMNQETDLLEEKRGETVRRDPGNAAQAAQIAAKMRAFMQYLTAKAPEGMEIHWYDSMLPDGRVVWQNELNAQNVSFLQDGTARVSDAIFLNYWWNRPMIERSAALAERAGRSRYDVYVGADVWPARTNNQAAFRDLAWLSGLFVDGGNRGLGSVALFAPNFAYDSFDERPELRLSRFRDDPLDHATFYDAETRFFAGDDRNELVADNPPDAPIEAWDGLARFVPARSPLTGLPFSTSFNTGHGLAQFDAGRKSGGAWHDMSRQDVQPQFLFGWTGADAFRASYDFADAYDGGSSLRFDARGSVSGTQRFPLFLTRFASTGATEVAVTCKSSGDGAAAIVLSLSNGVELTNPLRCGENEWQTSSARMNLDEGAVVVSIGVQLSSAGPRDKAERKFSLSLGRIDIR